jgi:hypothetical protein
MYGKRVARITGVLVVAWLAVAGAAAAKDETPRQPKAGKTSPCSEDYKRWCEQNLKNFENKTCRDISYDTRADGKCECNCRDKPGGTTPPGKKRIR